MLFIARVENVVGISNLSTQLSSSSIKDDLLIVGCIGVEDADNFGSSEDIGEEETEAIS